MRCGYCGGSVGDFEKRYYEVHNNGESVITICEKCLIAMNTCDMCQHRDSCAFIEAIDDPTPPFIIKFQTIQNGNMVIRKQMQVPNGERVKRYCSTCHCCKNGGETENWYCWKSCAGTCSNYKE